MIRENQPVGKWPTPEKIAYQYMNRIAIDENTAFEIKAVIELKKIIERHEKGLVSVCNLPSKRSRFGFITNDLIKAKSDEEIIKGEFQRLSKIGPINDDIDYHFIFSGNPQVEELSIMEIIKEYNFRSVVITKLNMGRYFFVTKETMEGYYMQQIDFDLRLDFPELKNYRIKHEESFLKESIGDDLELFFEKLQIGEIKKDSVSFYLPKAKAQERKLIEERKSAFIYRHFWKSDFSIKEVDVNKKEMALSESNSKFIFYCGQRETTRYENIEEAINRLKTIELATLCACKRSAILYAKSKIE